MKKIDIINATVFFVLLLFDIATNKNTNFLISLSFITAVSIKNGSLVNILYFLLMDSLFGKFLGFFTLPVFIGVIFAGFVSSKIKVPLFLQVLSPYTFLFFVLLSFTKNLFYSFQFMVSSIIFSTFFIFIISLKDYEQKKT